MLLSKACGADIFLTAHLKFSLVSCLPKDLIVKMDLLEWAGVLLGAVCSPG